MLPKMARKGSPINLIISGPSGNSNVLALLYQTQMRKNLSFHFHEYTVLIDMNPNHPYMYSCITNLPMQNMLGDIWNFIFVNF